MLAISDLHVAYGQSEVLHGLNVSVAPNEIVAIMGRNGMGKTTLMKSLMGILPTKSGSVTMEGAELSSLQSYERVAKGLAYVPQGRMIFSTMTVKENIETGLVVSGESEVPGDIYELFPVLLEMKSRRGGNLSGGQQQQLAIARALATKPKVLLLDEPTEGIQPSIIKDMARTLKRIRDQRGLVDRGLRAGPELRARHRRPGAGDRERRDRARRRARRRRCRADLEISVRLNRTILVNRGTFDARHTDQSRSHESAYENDMIHNRWHPDVPMVAWVSPGDDFIIETYDWTGGFIKNNDSADDVRDIDLSIVHFLCGPIGVKGAEPGDLLVVDLLDVGPLKESLWGFNGFFSKKNGGGFLTDHFPLAQKSIWDIQGLYTSSRHVPGVNFAGLMHPGLIGCLPDPKLLATWNERETALIATDPTRVPPLANPPFAADRACRPGERRRQGQGRRRGRAHRAAARTWRQLRHQGPVARLEDLFPGLCAGRRALDGRPALQPGRRRDHLLRRHRDGGLAASQGRHHQGRRAEIRHQESRSSSRRRSRRTTRTI